MREGGDTLTVTDKSSGYITSHEEFNFGLTFFDIGQDYMLTLGVPTTAVKIKIKYISFNIGGETVSKCEGDGKMNTGLSQFTIVNGDTPLYGCGGGGKNPSQNEFNLISKSNAVAFRLNTRGTTPYSGYLIKHESKYVCSRCL